MLARIRNLESYDSIIQNLIVLNDTARETKSDEAKAIEDIICTLSDQRDSVYGVDDLLISLVPPLLTNFKF